MENLRQVIGFVLVIIIVLVIVGGVAYTFRYASETEVFEARVVQTYLAPRGGQMVFMVRLEDETGKQEVFMNADGAFYLKFNSTKIHDDILWMEKHGALCFIEVTKNRFGSSHRIIKDVGSCRGDTIKTTE